MRARDPGCLISGLQVAREDYARFKAAHIFPCAYDVEVCFIELILLRGLNVECAVE